MTKTVLCCVTIFLPVFCARAQLSLSSNGLPVQTFETLPPVTEWATLNMGPSSASGVATLAQMDLAVQTNAAATINLALAADSATVPVLSTTARWNSTGRFLSSRANGNTYTVLKATLRNDTGSDLPEILMQYDLGARVAAGSSIKEEIPGLRVYYSFDGAPGTWNLIPSLSSATPSEQGPKTAHLVFSNSWAHGQFLFLLFADDNGSFGSTAPNHEGAYTIDNFSVATPRVVITAQPQPRTVAPGDTVNFSVAASGLTPMHFQWRKDGINIEGATNVTFRIDAATLADQGSYSVSVSNAYNSVVSSSALLTVAIEPLVVLSSPTNSRVALGGRANFAVQFTGTVRRIQWFRNGEVIPNATNASLVIDPVTMAAAGVYKVSISNEISVLSREASLHVPWQTVLVPLTNTWRFDATGSDRGFQWREDGYDDTGWPEGRAVLGMESLPAVTVLTNTVLPLTNAAGEAIRTFYFRTSFTVTNDLLGATLLTSNLVDDGAVVYLNGFELNRQAMPSGIITAATWSSAPEGGVGEGVFLTLPLPAQALRVGDNLLAAEVHQWGSSSSDVVFGLAMLLVLPDLGPPAIRLEPQSRAAWEGSMVTIAAGIAGTQPLGLQWLRDGQPVPGATNVSMILSNASLTDQGVYQLRVSNQLGVVLSSNAELRLLSANAPSFTLVPFTNEWRYDASGLNRGSSWRSNSYPDLNWASGRGIFAEFLGPHTEPINTVVSVPRGFAGSGTIYFRTRFVAPGTNLVADLVFSNLLDDGAVFYLNGNELFRTRIDPGPVSFETFAAGSPSNGQSYEVTLLRRVPLLVGENVLAVEVHQSSASSLDVTMGVRVQAFAAGDEPVQILSEPMDIAVPAGYAATLSAEVFGGAPISLQWLKDGQPISGATNTSYILPVAGPADGGLYQLRASNSLNVVFSREALLTVGPETNPPVTLIRGPYLQNGTSNSVLVRWRTDVLAGSRVLFGTNAAEFTSSAFDPTLRFEHAVRLTNLAANTRYYYAASTSFTNLAAGEEFSFLTPPAGPKPTRIWVQGDHGTATAAARQVVNAFTNFNAGVNPDVWLLLGDNAYTTGTDEEYQAALFDFMPDVLRGTLLWTTIGNHETYSSDQSGHFPYLDIFDPPMQGEAGGAPSGSRYYYSFDYGNIHFVCLDSEVSDRSTNGPMASWLREDLAINDKDWLIAFWHSPPYTRGSHDSDNAADSGGRMVDMRENFLPILEAHGVDLVLGGHSHCYERSRLMHGHYGFSPSLTDSMVTDAGDGRETGTGAYRKNPAGSASQEGTIYMVAGNAGMATFGTLDHPIMEFSALEMGSVVIDIDGQRMDARFLRDTGIIRDHFTIVKGAPADQFRIAKFHINGGEVRAAWKSRPGAWYQVLASDDVGAEEWSPEGGMVQATGATTFWTNAVAGDRFFYRIREVQP